MRNQSEYLSIRPPRWGFTKGLLVGAITGIPAIAGTLWLIASRLDPHAHLEFADAVRTTALFAGGATLISAGGVGRLAAYVSVGEPGGRRRATGIAAAAFACVGALAVLVAALAEGLAPDRVIGWLATALAGAAAGTVIGAIIGSVCAGPAQLALPSARALARWPTEAVRDLVREAETLLQAGAGVARRKRPTMGPIAPPGPAPDVATSTPPADADEPVGVDDPKTPT